MAIQFSHKRSPKNVTIHILITAVVPLNETNKRHLFSWSGRWQYVDENELSGLTRTLRNPHKNFQPPI